MECFGDLMECFGDLMGKKVGGLGKFRAPLTKNTPRVIIKLLRSQESDDIRTIRSHKNL
jgi:hypothetical protein